MGFPPGPQWSALVTTPWLASTWTAVSIPIAHVLVSTLENSAETPSPWDITRILSSSQMFPAGASLATASVAPALPAATMDTITAVKQTLHLMVAPPRLTRILSYTPSIDERQ
jgi:hypothetical protein